MVAETPPASRRNKPAHVDLLRQLISRHGLPSRRRDNLHRTTPLTKSGSGTLHHFPVLLKPVLGLQRHPRSIHPGERTDRHPVLGQLRVLQLQIRIIKQLRDLHRIHGNVIPRHSNPIELLSTFPQHKRSSRLQVIKLSPGHPRRPKPPQQPNNLTTISSRVLSPLLPSRHRSPVEVGEQTVLQHHHVDLPSSPTSINVQREGPVHPTTGVLRDHPISRIPHLGSPTIGREPLGVKLRGLQLRPPRSDRLGQHSQLTFGQRRGRHRRRRLPSPTPDKQDNRNHSKKTAHKKPMLAPPPCPPGKATTPATKHSTSLSPSARRRPPPDTPPHQPPAPPQLNPVTNRHTHPPAPNGTALSIFRPPAGTRTGTNPHRAGRFF